MALPNKFLNLAFYVYPNAKFAKNGEKMGGSAFWVHHKSTAGNDYLYAVTNAHVIEGIKSLGSRKCALRFNTTDGKTDIIETDIGLWKCHPDGDDLAIYPLNPSESWRIAYVSSEQFILPDMLHGDFASDEPPFYAFPETINGNETTWLEVRKVGIGDETITVGRYSKYSGIRINLPVVRFGHISMLPFEDEPITQDRPGNPGFAQVSFLVETHSINGFSGSPVLVNTMARLRNRTVDDKGQQTSNGTRYGQNGIYLLGIDWGHFDFQGDIINPNDLQKVKLPSGMMCAVPAWKLLELLNSDALVLLRKETDQKLHEKSKNSATADSSMSKEEFEEVAKQLAESREAGGTH